MNDDTDAIDEVARLLRRKVLLDGPVSAHARAIMQALHELGYIRSSPAPVDRQPTDDAIKYAEAALTP